MISPISECIISDEAPSSRWYFGGKINGWGKLGTLLHHTVIIHYYCWNTLANKQITWNRVMRIEDRIKTKRYRSVDHGFYLMPVDRSWPAIAASPTMVTTMADVVKWPEFVWNISNKFLFIYSVSDGWWGHLMAQGIWMILSQFIRAVTPSRAN